MNRSALIILTALCSLALTSAKKDPSQKAFKKKIDDYVHDHLEGFKYFAKTKTSIKPFEVGHSWPENLDRTYSVFYDKNAKVIFAMVGEDNEWGDYSIQYRYYFDKDGRTEAFERLARFYHSVCVNNDAILESRAFYYDRKFKRIGQDFYLKTDENKKLDSLDCDFPYNFSYPIYSSWQQLKDTSGLP